MSDVRDPRTYAIIGAAMEVHRQLGHGFLEGVYQEALAIEFENRKVPFAREVDLPVEYAGRVLKMNYRADFVCFGEVLVELKALGGLTNTERSQVINYLKVTGYEVGLLLNFGTSSLQQERLILSSESASSVKSVD